MDSRTKKTNNKRFVRYSEGAEMYSMSTSKFMQLAKDAKACYKVNQLVLVNLDISRCDTIRIAMFDEPYPYIVPVNFGEEIIGDQVVFYIHTDYEGKKNDLLAKNPNIAFEMDCNHELYYRESNMSCNFRYESVVGTGRVEIVLEEEKEKALTLLMNHYHPVSVKFNPKFVHMTQCLSLIHI